MPTTHILFDFFGTLVDYSRAPIGRGFETTFSHLEKAGYADNYDSFIQLWSQIYTQLDNEASRSHQEFTMFDLADELVHQVFRKPNTHLSRSIVRTYMTEWNRGVNYLPGVESLLSRLSEDYVLGVVSNTHEEELVPGHLAAMGVIELFRNVPTSVGFGIRKPNRAIFDHAIDSLSTTAENCIYVGDNYAADFRGATAAGIKTYLIDPSNTAPVPDEVRIDSVLSLTTRLST